LAESEDFPHLVEALDQVLRPLGGVTNEWRFDRISTADVAQCRGLRLRATVKR
jgi:hypothetical protein